MKKRIKQAGVLLLAAVMVMTLFSACGGEEQTGVDPNSTVYVASFQELKADTGNLSYVSSSVISDSTVYMAAQIEEQNGDEYTYLNKLLAISRQTGEMKELASLSIEDFAPGMQGDVSIVSMQLMEDESLWLMESVYSYSFNLPADFNPETDDQYNYYVDNGNEFYLVHISATGEELARVPIKDVLGENSYPSGFQIAADGTIYIICGWEAVYVLDSAGTLQFKVEDTNLYNTLVTLSDGSVAALRWGENAEFCKIDPATKAFGETLPFNATNFNRFYPGDDKYDFYYDNQNSVYGYKASTQTSEKLFDWLSADVDGSNIGCLSIGADGVVTALSTEWDDSYTNQILNLVTLTPKKASEVEMKTSLTLATMYMDSQLRNLVLDFNRTNETYRIDVKDYSEFNTQDDYSAGQTKLATEIISGNVPDILAVSGLPIDQYASKGLLEDLWPYIDADTDLGGRDALVAPVFEALQTDDGKLYEITSGFSIDTALGLSQVVGTEMGWTWEDMEAAMAKMPEGATVFSPSTTKETGMYTLVYSNLDQFVDWSTGECSIDSPDFIKMLEFVNTFPAEYDWESEEAQVYIPDSERLRNGEQMLATAYIYNCEYFLVDQLQYGGDITYVGYPSSDKSGSSFSLQDSYAMSSKCEHKDGVWEFIRQFLTEEYQEEAWGNLPTNQARLDAMLKEAMTQETTTDENGNIVNVPLTTWYVDDQEYEIYAMTQEQADELMEIINSTHKIARYDENISGIIGEEVEAYFAGQRSVQDTANMIQSRVKLYVNEQR